MADDTIHDPPGLAEAESSLTKSGLFCGLPGVAPAAKGFSTV